LKPTHYRERIGIDTLTITPTDNDGNTCCHVIVEYFSKFAGIYPSKGHTALETALACFLHFTRYGKFEEIYSDPGSDLTSETVRYLNLWLGQKHVFSIVDRHESNGVEPTNKKILNHPRCLIFDIRLKHKWSDSLIISLIQHQCNCMVHSETGFSAFELKFGSKCSKGFMILPDDNLHDKAPVALKLLNDDLENIRAISYDYQQTLVKKRDNSLETLNKYQPGDYVLFYYSVSNKRDNKLDTQFSGPHIVILHVHNEVSVRRPKKQLSGMQTNIILSLSSLIGEIQRYVQLLLFILDFVMGANIGGHGPRIYMILNSMNCIVYLNLNLLL
jgi:hypothetical protein